MDLETPLNYQREGEIDQEKGGRRRYLCTQVLIKTMYNINIVNSVILSLLLLIFQE